MPKSGLAFLFLLLVGYLSGYSQSLAPPESVHHPVCRTLPYTADSVWVDSLSIVPESLQVVIKNDTLLPHQFRYNYTSGYLSIDQIPADTKIAICYRRLPFSLHQVHARRDLSVYDSAALFQEIRYADRYANHSLSSQETLISTPKLQKSGSLSRGISFGNRQDMFVNAALNLQLEGKLTDDLSIRAAITDQNVPLQPDGTTQQLQQFDNVFIEFEHQYATLTVGDVQLRYAGATVAGVSRNASLMAQPGQPYFLKYRRNVQGGLLQSHYSVGKEGKAQTSVGAAIAKGRFASVNLSIQEGIQGPYRLNATTGRREESGLMFYILANSEKVYHNGELLQRGFDQDYTIDYNLGEITFTPRVVLTQFSRLVVDYEYAERSYSRSILTASHQQTHQKVSFSVNFYQESDHARRPIGFELTDEDYQQLSEAGDQAVNQMVAAVDTVRQNTSDLAYGNQQADVPGVGNVYQILYAQQDTVVAGVSYQIFVFSQEEDAIYRPRFSLVGNGSGDYVLKTSQVNGKVFEWIAPQNGISQGNYAPTRQLSAPQRRRVVSINTEVALTKRDQLFTEVAFSEKNLNTLSELDSQDDHGKALVLGYRSQPRPIFSGSAYRWSQQIQFEYTDRHFQAVDPFRSVDFERDWSSFFRHIPQPVKDDHVLQAQAQLVKNVHNRLQYRWVGRRQTNWLSGNQHSLEAAQEWGGFRLSGRGFLMQSRYPQQQASWKRVKLDIHRPTRWLTPGYTYRREENEVRDLETDSVAFSAEHYDEHQWYLAKGDSIRGTFRLDYRIRNNRLPLGGKMKAREQVQMLQANWDKPLGEQHTLRLNATYRNISPRNQQLWESSANGNLLAQTVMGQLDWKGSLLKKSLQMSLAYTLANGREIRRDFIYVRVPTGEGLFTWRDSNGNGVEELDEFFEARYWDERNYVRVLVPSNEYIQAFTNQLSYQLKAQFPRSWQKSSGLKTWLARFSNVTSWQTLHKQTDEKLAARVLPGYQVSEDNLLSAKQQARTTFFFNRQNPRFGAEGGLRTTRWKQLLQQGSEDRFTQMYRTQLRYQWNRKWKVTVEGQQLHRKYTLETAAATNSTRNFDITAYRLAPELHWQPHLDIRVVTRTSWTNKVNSLAVLPEASGETATLRSVGGEIQSSRVMKRNINATLEWLKIDYNADATQAVAYEMLEGLLPGNNARWTINLQQQLLEGLQLTVNYQGRKSPEQATVHSGSVSVRALF
ncbi:hypothetical protein [Tunicatimonas pelagia]|uniref:hypothetical protein n=1 Tax=Tunicatimonas pelagia TaxID=931531 RepID=UPI002665FCC4|nr:hypothetical protein [Tunicatimonas pelagia]WKN42854.1 hypothetical protein P0M28_27845 [Tunicatimonas pelagia]